MRCIRVTSYTTYSAKRSALSNTPAYSLALAAGLNPTRVLVAEIGLCDVFLDDLERIAQVFGIKVVELFYAPGRTVAERVV